MYSEHTFSHPRETHGTSSLGCFLPSFTPSLLTQSESVNGRNIRMKRSQRNSERKRFFSSPCVRRGVVGGSANSASAAAAWLSSQSQQCSARMGRWGTYSDAIKIPHVLRDSLLLLCCVVCFFLPPAGGFVFNLFLQPPGDTK